MRDGIFREIGKGPDGQKHQADEKERGERHDSIDHFPFGNQVHEIAGHQERFAASDDERHADIERVMSERDVRGPDGDQRAE